MKTAWKKITAVLLIFALLGCLIAASAEGTDWTCPDCGQTGNAGNFCSNCGAARLAANWTCPDCGQAGNTGNFCSNCGKAKPENNSSAAPVVNERLEQIAGESDRVRIRLQSVDASSYIANKKDPSKWLPSNAADGDESTCWQFSAKKGLKGKSWISLNIGSSQTVNEIWFKNGFWAYNDKGKDQYSINARPKGVRVEFMYEGASSWQEPVELTLKDEAFTDWQRFSLGAHPGVQAVRVAVLSTYPGSHFKNDVCLSEVMLVQHAPAASAAPPQAARQATVYESRPEVSGAGLLMKLATRSGPGTEYDEPGTFFGNSWAQTTVRVLGKSWDGSIWWVLVDFSNGNKGNYRVWTGLKRVDVDIDRVKEIYGIGQGTVSATSETFRGPGGRYARANVTISDWRDVVAFGRENGFVEVEFQQGARWYRLWVPENVTSIDWGTDFSGNK